MSANDGDTKVVGLVGWPVEHSVSPAMFNAAFAQLKLNWRYDVFPAPPDRLKEVLRELRGQCVRGVNITVPHKHAVISLVDVLHPEAKAIGAVNTVTFIENNGKVKLHGFNTDIEGFQGDLLRFVTPDEKNRVLVLGSGGSARAVVYVLGQQGFHVTVAARNPNKALELIHDIQVGFTPGKSTRPGKGNDENLSTHWRMRMLAIPWNRIPDTAAKADLIVNCTPIGMWPNVDESPLPDETVISSSAVVYDLIYRPHRTKLAAQAEAAGAKAVTGLGMLIRQGAAAFKQWTGQDAPLDVMTKAAQKALTE